MRRVWARLIADRSLDRATSDVRGARGSALAILTILENRECRAPAGRSSSLDVQLIRSKSLSSGGFQFPVRRLQAGSSVSLSRPGTDSQGRARRRALDDDIAIRGGAMREAPRARERVTPTTRDPREPGAFRRHPAPSLRTGVLTTTPFRRLIGVEVRRRRLEIRRRPRQVNVHVPGGVRRRDRDAQGRRRGQHARQGGRGIRLDRRQRHRGGSPRREHPRKTRGREGSDEDADVTSGRDAPGLHGRGHRHPGPVYARRSSPHVLLRDDESDVRAADRD